MIVMIQIAVCDDNKVFLDHITYQLYEIIKELHIEAEIHQYNHASQLLELYDQINSPFNIIFLDIDMPDIDGLETAKYIRQRDENVILIFLTSMEDRVFESFEYNAFRFIRKGYIFQELKLALQKAWELLTKEVKLYTFKTKEEEIKLSLGDILYFEFVNRNVEVKTFEQRYSLTIKRFSDIVEQFSDKGFIMIHRGCIVNVKYIRSIGYGDITLDTGEMLPVSRYRVSEIRKAFTENAR